MQVHGSTNEDKGDNFDVEEKRRMGQRGRDLIVHRYIIINSLHRSFLLIRVRAFINENGVVANAENTLNRVVKSDLGLGFR